MYSLVSIMFVASKKKLLFSFSHKDSFLKTNSFGDGHLGFLIPVKKCKLFNVPSNDYLCSVGFNHVCCFQKIAFISTFPLGLILN